jgi:hypothetical protein
MSTRTVARPTRPSENVGGAPVDVAGPPEEQREAEDEQEVAGDRAHQRCPHDLGQAVGDRDDRDDQLWRIAERRIEKAAYARAGAQRDVVRRLADQPRQRDERRRGEHEQLQLVGITEPVQDDDHPARATAAA